MDYSLAKRLKDSGFPQKPDAIWDKLVGPEPIYYPTLSELIEACGDYFESLVRTPEGKYKTNTDIGYSHDFGASNGTTPEEAVANLWLALNEKK